jgi:hypothetical protein
MSVPPFREKIYEMEVELLVISLVCLGNICGCGLVAIWSDADG